ncbi:MAG: NFACT family protein, partial [Acidobacteria bacterium]|nr:NFACT family protein [Acidobacteriota bacterium]
MTEKNLLEVIKKDFLGKKITKVVKADDFVVGLSFENKENLFFSTHPLLIGISLSSKNLPEIEQATLLKENLVGFYLSDCQKIENEPIFLFYFKGVFEKFLVFEGLKRCSNLLLLDENRNVLWALRTFKGEFRQGLPFEKWIPPPSKNEYKDDTLLE